MPHYNSFFNIHNPEHPQLPTQPFEGFEYNWSQFAAMSPYEYNVIDDLTNPFLRQYIEWSQQMTSQMYSNWWNSEPERMKRMIEAGINPYLAANGISGQGTSPEVSAPNSAIGQGAENLHKMASAAAGLVGAASNGVQGYVAAKSMMQLLPHQIKELDSRGLKQLEEAGFTSVQTEGFVTDNFYRQSHHVADLNIKQQNLENMKMEWSYIETQRDLNKKQLDVFDERFNAELDLTKKNAILAEKQAFLAQSHKTEIDLENRFFEHFGFHSDSNVDVSLRNIWHACTVNGDFEPYNDAVAAAYNYYNGLNYNLYSGQQNAMAEYTFKIALAHRKGENAADVINGHVSGWSDLVSRGINLGIVAGGFGHDLHSGKEVRKQLAELLSGCYDRLEKVDGESRETIIHEIDKINLLLQLSNKELYQYYKGDSKE